MASGSIAATVSVVRMWNGARTPFTAEEVSGMYEIRGKYPGEPWETIDEADTKQEATRLLAEYRMAYGPDWRLCIKKVAT